MYTYKICLSTIHTYIHFQLQLAIEVFGATADYYVVGGPGQRLTVAQRLTAWRKR